MKNKIKNTLIIFIILQFFFSVKCMAQIKKEDIIKEVADAYYYRGVNAQYSNYRRDIYTSPEQSTSQNTTYKDCSAFTFSVYYEALGIKIPKQTKEIVDYAKENYYSPEVIEYWEHDENGYKDINGNNINNLISEYYYIDNNKKAYKFFEKYNIQVGDLLCIYEESEGHVVLVYDLIKNENGETVDALIRESTAAPETTTTKLKINYAKLFNSKNNIYEGSFQERYLGGGYLSAANYTGEPKTADGRPYRYSFLANTHGSSVTQFAILRFLQEDENGNIFLNYKGENYGDRNYTNEVIYRADGSINSIPEKTRDRLKYSKLYIEKTVDAFNNSVVSPSKNLRNTKLKYTIKIKNNSNKDYTDNITITEDISKYVTFEENSTVTVYANERTPKIINVEPSIVKDNNGKVTSFYFRIGKLRSNEEISIEYTVNVNKNTLGETIESTGKIANIPSTTIKNTVGNNLNERQKNALIEEFTNNLKQKNGKDLIFNTYKNALDIELDYGCINFEDFIKDQKDGNYTKMYLDEENAFYNHVLNNYYGKLIYYNKTGTMLPRKWALTNGKNDRADNIYSGNLQTGDILIYKNKQTADNDYIAEDGTYYLMYISEKDKITIDGNEVYGFIGINEDSKLNNIYRDESSYETTTDYSINDLRTLLAKDYYVIFRPSLVMSNEELEVDIRGVEAEQEGEFIYAYTTTQNMTEEDLRTKIETNGDIQIEAKGPNGKIGTGSTIRITKGEEIEEYVLIVKGDLNGDSMLDDRDFLKMVRYEAELDNNLEGAYLRAGNLIKDEACIDDKDLLKMARILVGLDSIE